MKLLPLSTAITPKVGPFLSSTDGATAQTALTITQADCILFKNNGAGAQKNSATGATHDTGGVYGVPFSTTDTGTLGPLKLLINKSGALPVWEDWMVVPVNVYNALVLNTADLNVNVDAVGGVTANATALAAVCAASITGTSDNTGFTATTTTMDSTITEATTDHFKGRIINFTSGALLGQSSDITGYSLVGGRGRFVFTALTEAVPNGTTFVIT